MKEITINIDSNREIWSIIDKNFNHILIHKFMPSEALEWWLTDIRLKNNEKISNVKVRNMTFDVLTDLNGLKKFLDQNTNQLRIYQFDKPVANTLALDFLPEKNREQILLQNGLKHFYFCNFEFLTIASADKHFINNIESKHI